MIDATSTTLGQVIDAMDNVQPTFAEGDLVVDAVVILEVLEADGTTRLCVTYPDGMSFIKRNGMLNLALSQDGDQIGPVRVGDDDDEDYV